MLDESRSSAEAAAQLSLFLRSRGIFALGDGTALTFEARLWFYVVASRVVIPAADRWFSACQVSSADEDVLDSDTLPTTLRALGQTCLERVNWAVRSRDQVLSVVDSDLIPFYLDAFLLQMSGAFDALAHVTARGLGVHVNRVSPSWRTLRWLDALRTSNPGLAALMDPGSAHRDTIEIVSLLRNSIHDSGLPAVGISTSIHGPTRTTVRSPPRNLLSPVS